MKANELRLGNYIYRNGLMEVRVISKSGVKVYDHVNKMFHPTYFSFDENIQPIQLTEECLLKLGFKKDDNGYLWKDEITHYLELMPVNEDWYPVWATVPEFQSETEQRSTMNSINSVHQLQNLYYALTGTDLTIPVSEKPLCGGAIF